MTRPRKLRLVPPIEKLRHQVARSRQLAEQLRAELAAAEQVAARDRAALDAAEARRAARRSPGYRAFVDAQRAMAGELGPRMPERGQGDFR